MQRWDSIGRDVAGGQGLAVAAVLALIGLAGTLGSWSGVLPGGAPVLALWWLLVLSLGAVVLAALRRPSRTLHQVAGALDDLAAERLDSAVARPLPLEVARRLDALTRTLRALRQQGTREREQGLGRARRLEHQIQAREQELAAARAQAQAAEQRGAHFLASIGREIQTPVESIRRLSEILSQELLQDDARDQLATLRETCDDLLVLVGEVQEFSRFEASGQRLDPTAMDIRDSVEEVVALLAPAAYAKGLELHALVYADVPGQIYGDPVRIRQVLTHLVHNAIKFTPSGEVVVRLMLEEETPQAVLLKGTVSDTGIGLSPADLHRLPVDATDAGLGPMPEGGSGLGLSICQRVVHAMKGRLGVESEPEKGSTFWFTLRLERLPETESATARPSGLEGCRLLLLDNLELARNTLRGTLESWGVSVTATGDADCALELAAEGRQRWQAAVLALGHGELQGATTRAVLQRLAEVGVPVLVLASTVDRAELRALHVNGVGAALSRSARRQTLWRELCRLVRASPADAREPATTPGGTATSRLRVHLQQMLVEELPEHRQAIRQAYRRGDVEALRQHVHRLHGAVSVCHQESLRLACGALEKALAEGHRAAVPGLVRRLHEAADRLAAPEGASPGARIQRY